MSIEESFNRNFFSSYIGKELKKYREQKQITLTELADNIWVSHSYITNLLNGRNNWTTEVFRKIAYALGVSENDFKKIIVEARKAEYEYTTGEKLWCGDLWNKNPDELLEEVLALNFRHSWINNKEAEIEAKAMIKFLIDKYHKK